MELRTLFFMLFLSIGVAILTANAGLENRVSHYGTYDYNLNSLNAKTSKMRGF